MTCHGITVETNGDEHETFLSPDDLPGPRHRGLQSSFPARAVDDRPGRPCHQRRDPRRRHRLIDIEPVVIDDEITPQQIKYRTSFRENICWGYFFISNSEKGTKYAILSEKLATIKTDMETIVMYSDGGSRGNPGPAALGVYIETLDKQYGEFLGTKTNNEAEYLAIVSGLKKIKSILGKAKAKTVTVECRMDSELAMKQLTHQYKVEKEHIQKLCFLVWNLTHDFAEVKFVHVYREANTIADAMANKAMDEAQNKQTLL